MSQNINVQKASGTNALTGNLVVGDDVTLTASGTGSIAATSAPAAGITGTLAVAHGGTGVTTSTGSGSVVLSNSPALTTPNLGTPSAATLTNATGLPLTTGVTGTLPVGNGGTGATTLTGYVKGSGTSAFTASATVPGSDVSGNIAGNAAGLTNTLVIGSGGTGVTTTPTNGQILIGNGTGYTVANISAGVGVSIANGSGSIQISADGGVNYQGTWNANTNTPTLTSSVGTKGFYYVVNVAGSTNLNGITDWKVGDWALFNGSVWEKVDNTDQVTSVFGRQGAVTAVSTDYSAVGITNTAIGATNPSTGNFTSVSTTTGAVTVGGTGTYGALQLPAGTTTPYGIAFGTDTNLWRTDTGNVEVGGASVALIGLNVGGTNKGYFYNNGTDTTLAGAGTLTFKSNGTTTGLTLDSSNATVAGNLTVSGTGAVTGNLNFGAKLVGNNDATNYYIGDSAGRLKINWYGGIDLVTETTTNNVKIPSTVGSSSTTTGALVVSGGVGVAGAINAGGNLTVSGTTGVTATDLTLGTSGPSVKSTLSARAPRQGLVFDGSGTQATLTVPAFGSGDFTASAWVREDNSFAGTPVVMIGSGVGGFYMEFDANGFPYVAVQGGAGVLRKATTACVVKKLSLITYVKTSGTGIWYVNGIAAGSDTDSNNYTGGIATLSSSAPYNLTGYVFPLIYNRALSAAEVVALYEAGVPSGADYNNAGTTDIKPSAGTYSYWFGTGSISSATASSFTIDAGANNLNVRNAAGTFALVSGRKYRMTIVASGLSATSGVGAQVVSTTFVSNNITNGTNIVEFTANGTGNCYFNFELYSTAGGSISISSIQALGLLLAPDAGQAGGGLVWYDTSGNAANITLPASGVSWNVPTSGTTGGNRLFTGLVDINNDLYIGSGNIIALARNNPTYNTIKRDTTNGGILLTANSNTLLFKDNGNLIVGSPSVDGGQTLQVSGTAYVSSNLSSGARITAGNGFTATSTVPTIVAASTNLDYNSVGAKGRLFVWGPDSGTVGAFELNLANSTNSSLITALSFDSSGNATFAGNIIGSKDIQLGNTYTLSWGGAYGAGIPSIAGSTGAGHVQIYPTGSTSGATATFTASTSTFNTPIAINNTVQTAAGVASTHKVTISIGGATYYLLATT